MGGSPALGGRADHRNEVQCAGEAVPDQNCDWLLGPPGQQVLPVKTGRCFTERYPRRTNRTNGKGKWCQYIVQTREHLLLPVLETAVGDP